MKTVTVELTDTFQGEANYSWVKREQFDSSDLTDRQIITKAKQLMGLTGMRTKKTNFGDEIKLDFSPSICQVMFIRFEY